MLKDVNGFYSKETFRSDHGAQTRDWLGDCSHLSIPTAHTAPRMQMSVHDVSKSASELWYN